MPFRYPKGYTRKELLICSRYLLFKAAEKWTDTRTGKSFSIPIDLDVVAKGTRYSKEFGAFLIETYGVVPRDLPYA